MSLTRYVINWFAEINVAKDLEANALLREMEMRDRIAECEYKGLLEKQALAHRESWPAEWIGEDADQLRERLARIYGMLTP